MPFETKNKVIDNHSVDVGMFPAVTGLRLKFRLFKKLGPGLTTLAKGLDNSGDNFTSKNLDLSVLPQALDKFFSTLEEDEFLDLVLRLLETTHIEKKHVGNQAIFDQVFAAEYGFLYKVLGFVVEVNFKSFLDLLPIGKAQEEKKPQSTEK